MSDINKNGPALVAAAGANGDEVAACIQPSSACTDATSAANLRGVCTVTADTDAPDLTATFDFLERLQPGKERTLASFKPHPDVITLAHTSTEPLSAWVLEKNRESDVYVLIGETDVDHIQRLNHSLAKAFGGDSCQNIDRAESDAQRTTKKGESDE